MRRVTLLLLNLFIIILQASSGLADSIPVFGRPFDGEHPLVNWHDHNVPQEFVDTNGVIVNSEGSTTTLYIDGHEGYDWVMDEGTPLHAVVDGTVFSAGVEAPFFCPLLDETTAGNLLVLQTAIGGETFYIVYAHSSQILVSAGQTVHKGDIIALSGNTGCSTLPHLHFSVLRTATNGPAQSFIDPYGWNGPGADPWLGNPLGAASLNLWEDGVGPARFLELSSRPNPCRACKAPVTVTKIRFMGPDDSIAPNNEFVEITLDRRFAKTPRQLKGFRVRNNAGATFRFRRSLKLKAGRSIRLYSGSGADTASERYWGKSSGQWNNNGDCVHIFDERGRLMYYFFTNVNNCRFLKERSGASIKGASQDPIRLPIEFPAPRETGRLR